MTNNQPAKAAERGSAPQLHRIYRFAELPKFVGLRRTVISEMIKAGTFPGGIPLNEGGRAIGWLECDLIAWQSRRIAAARNATAA